MQSEVVDCPRMGVTSMSIAVCVFRYRRAVVDPWSIVTMASGCIGCPEGASRSDRSPPDLPPDEPPLLCACGCGRQVPAPTGNRPRYYASPTCKLGEKRRRYRERQHELRRRAQGGRR